MSSKKWFLVVCVSILGCAAVFAQTTKITDPRPNEDAYHTEEFGNCTFGYGKDRARYIQPYLTCKSDHEAFVLVPQRDGTWAILVTPGDETDRSEAEERTSMLDVIVKVGENDPHEYSMLWPKRLNMAFESLELPALVGLLNELRNGDSLTISRNDEEIEFDLRGANQAFAEILFEQLLALSKFDEIDSP